MRIAILKRDQVLFIYFFCELESGKVSENYITRYWRGLYDPTNTKAKTLLGSIWSYEQESVNRAELIMFYRSS